MWRPWSLVCSAEPAHRSFLPQGKSATITVYPTISALNCSFLLGGGFCPIRQNRLEMEDALERRESRSIASPSADLQTGGAVPGTDVRSVSPEVAIQVVLADLLEEPGRELVPWIQERFPGRDLQFYGPVVNGARTIMDEVVSGLQKTSRGEPSQH